MCGIQSTTGGSFASATVAWDLHLSTVARMVGLAVIAVIMMEKTMTALWSSMPHHFNLLGVLRCLMVSYIQLMLS